VVRRPRAPAALAAAVLAAAPACSREEILHGVEERQAIRALVALEEGGVSGTRRRDDASEGGWVVEVRAAEAGRAQRILAERELPRPEGSGLAVLGKGSLVPTPSEERARLLLALAADLSRSVESIDGVVEARVHVGLAPDDPLRAGPAPAPRGAVLVKVRAGARARVEALAPGIRSLVAGAVAGLDPGEVAVVLTEAGAAPPPPAPPRRPDPALLALGLAAAAAALGILAAALRRHPLAWLRIRRSA